MSGRALVSTVLMAFASLAAAGEAPFPARSGESGLLDVPDSQVVGVGRGLLAAEMRFDHVAGQRDASGPFPVYAVAGLAERLELGLTMREWGSPGDPIPSRMLFGTAAKLQLVRATEVNPGFALSVVADRFNMSPVLGARLVASTRAAAPLRFTASLGGEAGISAGGERGFTYAFAAAFAPQRSLEAVLEALGGPRGSNFGAALRWSYRPTTTLQLGVNYLPADEGVRVSLGIAFGSAATKRSESESATPVGALPSTEPAEPELVLLDPTPHFRLRIRSTGADEPRSIQYAPSSGRTTVASAPAVPPARAAAPSVEDLAETQLKEQEPLAEARARRALATGDQLDVREQTVLAERKRLEDRERELAAREQQLDAREQRIAVRAAPTPQLRQLESLELQLSAQERQTLARERSFGPTIDAAEGRARDAGAREDAERQDADRLVASISAAPSRAQQLELRKQALAAKNRQLGAYELRLVARGERLEAVEQQLRTMGERLDARARRLDTRSERLDLLEKRTTDSRPVSAAPKTAGATPAAATAPKDKAVFVMVVKSPTAIMKEGKAASGAPAQPSVPQPSTAVEKAVAAATIVTFPTPASPLSELDRETIDDIAKLAAKEGCELLIWARAKDPRLMAEAQRRAAEIRARVMTVGALDAKQVVTRITTRPGAQGVDVVVSALRQAKATGAVTPASSAPSPAPGTGAAAAVLLSGESGKRQIREAVQAAQPSIEACVGEHLQARRVRRAEGTLKLTVSARGRVEKVAPAGDDLAGEGLEACLGRAANGWQFPTSEANYDVDVPITVMTGGPSR